MSGVGPTDPGQLLRLAKRGDGDALGRLLEIYRNYLKLLARLQIGRRLQGKVDASDVVQETFLQAHRGLAGFQGATEPEFLGWLRRILASRLTDLMRRYCQTRGRDVRLERQLTDELDRSSRIAQGLALSESTPSQKAARREQAVLVADALAELPADYHEVVILRHLEEHSFPEVARQMGRSLDSVKNLWVRALAHLHRSLGGTLDGPV